MRIYVLNLKKIELLDLYYAKTFQEFINEWESSVCEISQHLFAKFREITRYCYEISQNTG
jgi:hypothetical protein